jgi:hypothetical protein
MRRRAHTFLALVLATSSGCGTFLYPLNVPTEEVRAELGRVAVVVAPDPPALDLHHPPRGALRGLGVGLVRGIVADPIVAIGVGVHGVTPFDQFLLMLAAAVVYPPVSIVGAAATAPSTGAVDRATAALERAHATQASPERLQTLFVRLSRSLAARDCQSAGFATVGEVRAGHVDISPEDFDSIAVLTWTRTRNTWPLGMVSVDTKCRITTEVELHVFRARDLEQLYRTRVGHSNESENRTYRGWASAEASPLVSEIERALQEIPTALVERLFLLDPELADEPHSTASQRADTEPQRSWSTGSTGSSEEPTETAAEARRPVVVVS